MEFDIRAWTFTCLIIILMSRQLSYYWLSLHGCPYLAVEPVLVWEVRAKVIEREELKAVGHRFEEKVEPFLCVTCWTELWTWKMPARCSSDHEDSLHTEAVRTELTTKWPTKHLLVFYTKITKSHHSAFLADSYTKASASASQTASFEPFYNL